jgi:hypothetical protein
VVIAAAATNVALYVGAYTNDILGGLQRIGSGATASVLTKLAASMVAEAVAGVPIQIAVDSTAAAGLPFELTIRPLPPNDYFAGRTEVSGYQFSLAGYNHGATAESWEQPVSGVPRNTVWWSWTAPFTETLRLGVTNNFRSTVAIYAGPGADISDLNRLATVDVPTRGAVYLLPTIRGGTYHFAVDGQFGSTGDIRVLGVPDGVPVIDSLERTPIALRIRFRGVPGRMHRVESSTDSRSWLPGQSVFLAGDLGEVVLPLPTISAGTGVVFYRLTLLP